MGAGAEGRMEAVQCKVPLELSEKLALPCCSRSLIRVGLGSTQLYFACTRGSSFYLMSWV